MRTVSLRSYWLRRTRQVPALEGLLLQHLHHEVVQHVAVGRQDLPRLGVRRLDESGVPLDKLPIERLA